MPREWMSHSPGTQGSHGALLKGSESSCGQVPCGATMSAPPTWATGLAAGTAKPKGGWGPGLKQSQVRSWPSRWRQGEPGLTGV